MSNYDLDSLNGRESLIKVTDIDTNNYVLKVSIEELQKVNVIIKKCFESVIINDIQSIEDFKNYPETNGCEDALRYEIVIVNNIFLYLKTLIYLVLPEIVDLNKRKVDKESFFESYILENDFTYDT